MPPNKKQVPVGLLHRRVSAQELEKQPQAANADSTRDMRTAGNFGSEVMTVPETAAYLKISTRTAYNLARRADFPAFQISPNRIVVSRRGLEEWIEAQLARKKEPV